MNRNACGMLELFRGNSANIGKCLRVKDTKENCERHSWLLCGGCKNGLLTLSFVSLSSAFQIVAAAGFSRAARFNNGGPRRNVQGDAI